MHLSENQRVAALYFHLSELSEVERPPESSPVSHTREQWRRVEIPIREGSSLSSNVFPMKPCQCISLLCIPTFTVLITQVGGGVGFFQNKTYSSILCACTSTKPRHGMLEGTPGPWRGFGALCPSWPSDPGSDCCCPCSHLIQFPNLSQEKKNNNQWEMPKSLIFLDYKI